jgi:hypothetical protein
VSKVTEGGKVKNHGRGSAGRPTQVAAQNSYSRTHCLGGDGRQMSPSRRIAAAGEGECHTLSRETRTFIGSDLEPLHTVNTAPLDCFLLSRNV